MISIPLFSAQAHPCSYLPDKSAQMAFVHPSYPISTEDYSQLIRQGFRRSGDDVYRPHCSACSACIPVRIPVADFKPSRNQQRCLIKNRSIKVALKPAIFEQAHYDLYRRYQQIKHADSSMQYATADDYIRFLSSSWCNTTFVEFTLEGQLLAVAVIDRLEDALSAVYTFFDPDVAHLSLGVYAVLWQLHTARQLNLKWLYLGYWLADCKKMNYKNQYQPLEVFQNEQWVPYSIFVIIQTPPLIRGGRRQTPPPDKGEVGRG